MADLNEQQSSGSIKISGADSNGTETNFVGATINGDLETADILNSQGTQGVLTINSTPNLTGRKLVTLYHDSSNTVYWGYTSGVTTSNGTPLVKGQMTQWPVGDAIDIYLVASSSVSARITEAG
jgi:hypothetical protein